MPAFGPVKRSELIRYLRLLGLTGPYAGGKHQFMHRASNTLTLPNPHQVATLMFDAGVWAYPMHAAPPAIETEADLFALQRSPAKTGRPKRRSSSPADAS